MNDSKRKLRMQFHLQYIKKDKYLRTNSANEVKFHNLLQSYSN